MRCWVAVRALQISVHMYKYVQSAKMILGEKTVVIETILVNSSGGVENQKSEGGSGVRKDNGDGGSYDENNDNSVKASKTRTAKIFPAITRSRKLRFLALSQVSPMVCRVNGTAY